MDFRPTHSFTVALALLVGLLAPASGHSQQSTGAAPAIPRYEVRRAAGPLTIDGQIDEAAWRTASPPISLQFLWESQTGAKQGTLARLLWDDDYLYVSYELTDADINAVFLNRDDPTYRDDAAEIFINPNPSQLGLYYGFEVNARGVLYDYLTHDSVTLFKRYNADDVRIATNIRGTLNERGDVDNGWSLELAIPWRNFEELSRNRPAVGAVWTANLNRWDGIAPDRRMSIWSDPLQTRAHPHYPGRFGELVFTE